MASYSISRLLEFFKKQDKVHKEDFFDRIFETFYDSTSPNEGDN
jgi:hypothetical protein